MVPVATGLLGVLVGVFASSAARKPLPQETRFLNFDKATASRLLKGWSNPEGLPDGHSFAWCAAKSCSIRLYSYALGDRMLAFQADPFMFPNAPQQMVTVYLNGTSLGARKVNHGAVIRIPAPQSAWVSGNNEVRFEFGYAESPSDHSQENHDPRHLSASFHWLAVAGESVNGR
jgi:hypothetical protein